MSSSSGLFVCNFLLLSGLGIREMMALQNEFGNVLSSSFFEE